MYLTDDVGGLLTGLFKYLLFDRADRLCAEDVEGPRDYDERWKAKKDRYLMVAYEFVVSYMPPSLRDELKVRRDQVVAELLSLS